MLVLMPLPASQGQTATGTVSCGVSGQDVRCQHRVKESMRSEERHTSALDLGSEARHFVAVKCVACIGLPDVYSRHGCRKRVSNESQRVRLEERRGGCLAAGADSAKPLLETRCRIEPRRGRGSTKIYATYSSSRLVGWSCARAPWEGVGEELPVEPSVTWERISPGFRGCGQKHQGTGLRNCGAEAPCAVKPSRFGTKKRG